jgi:type II secretory pathway component PulF
MIDMFDNWGNTEWFILVVDIIAVIIVVRFLRNKIRRKLNEVELRQSFQTRQRRDLNKDKNDQPPIQ